MSSKAETIAEQMRRMGFDPKDATDTELFMATYHGGKITSKAKGPDKLHVGDRVKQSPAYRNGRSVGVREGTILDRQMSGSRATFLLVDSHGDKQWIYEDYSVKVLSGRRR
jgi:hypothetical protein